MVMDVVKKAKDIDTTFTRQYNPFIQRLNMTVGILSYSETVVSLTVMSVFTECDKEI